jgi:two-component system response regulator AtoC
MTVLISGESGTGKDIVARLLHQRSNRKAKPFVKVNCPAIPSELVESELFGYEKGAFTGAHTAKPGRFELAEKGTIFLDEITEISEASQVKLIIALDGEPYMRIGGVQPIHPDVRIVTATNVPIERALETGRIRRDVYSRLSEFIIHMRPLRERAEDIPVLAEHFNYNYCKKIEKPYEPIDERVLEEMQDLEWRGNIRALAARVKEYVATGEESVLLDDSNGPQGVARQAAAEAASDSGKDDDKQFTPLKEATRIAVELTERALIEEALRYTLWNRRKAAKLLDISYSSLLRRIDAYQIGKSKTKTGSPSE